MEKLEKEKTKVEEFVREIFGSKRRIIECRIAPLTKPGENYLSVMFKVDVTFEKNEESGEESAHAVAKCVRTDSEFAVNVFPKAFANEVNFYSEIVPALQNFERERGVEDVMDFFPKFYGARINKNGSDAIDDDVVLVLENLKHEGYTNHDRHIGFNLQAAKLILKDLATLHATALALKFTKKEEFDTKIKAYCKKAIPDATPQDRETYKQPITTLFEILEDYEGCKKYIPRIRDDFDRIREKINEFFDVPAKEPFATLVHCDIWVNNTMQLVKKEEFIKNKLVDFQLFYYQSPAADLLFFLWSSVQTAVLKEHLDALLQYYHSMFDECLRKLNCNTNLFTYQKFMEELDDVASKNFFDIVYMTMFIVFGKKDDENYDETKVRKEDVPMDARERVAFMVEEYGRRGWI